MSAEHESSNHLQMWFLRNHFEEKQGMGQEDREVEEAK